MHVPQTISLRDVAVGVKWGSGHRAALNRQLRGCLPHLPSMEQVCSLILENHLAQPPSAMPKNLIKPWSVGFRMRVLWQQNAASLAAGTIEGLRVILFVRGCFNLITYSDPCLISFGFNFGQGFFPGGSRPDSSLMAILYRNRRALESKESELLQSQLS